jgi:hypothetical protein
MRSGSGLRKQKPFDILKGVPAFDNAEAEAKAETSAVLQGFADRKKAEATRQAYAEDGEFFTCLIFQSKDQRDAFIKALSLRPEDPQYIDGQSVARALGIDLPAPAGKPSLPRIDKDLAALAL